MACQCCCIPPAADLPAAPLCAPQSREELIREADKLPFFYFLLEGSVELVRDGVSLGEQTEGSFVVGGRSEGEGGGGLSQAAGVVVPDACMLLAVDAIASFIG
jgi:hypothetical protein